MPKGVRQKLLDNTFFPSIPSLCLCGCNEIVYNGRKFILGHHSRIINSMSGKSAWNKGLTKETDERVKKYSISLSKNKSGIKRKNYYNPWKYFKDPDSVKKNMTGRPSPMKGKKHREDSKMKNSEKHKILFKDPKNHPMYGKVGERSPSWIDGRSFLPYCPKFNSELKEQVRIRDNHTCQLCNTPQNGRKHSVHHIHYDKENCYPDLICLCMKCNTKVNKISMRKYYEQLFMNKLNERELLFWTRRSENGNST